MDDDEGFAEGGACEGLRGGSVEVFEVLEVLEDESRTRCFLVQLGSSQYTIFLDLLDTALSLRLEPEEVAVCVSEVLVVAAVEGLALCAESALATVA